MSIGEAPLPETPRGVAPPTERPWPRGRGCLLCRRLRLACCSTSRQSPPRPTRTIAERSGPNHLGLSLFKVDMAAANLLSSAAAKRWARLESPPSTSARAAGDVRETRSEARPDRARRTLIGRCEPPCGARRFGAERAPAGIVSVVSATADDARRICTPCRGTGRVISGLGGNPHEVICPWCGGSGTFQSGRDAQQTGPAGADKPG